MKARQAKRLARSVLTLSLLVVVGAGFSTISSASDAAEKSRPESKSKYVQVVVTPGESIWSIAAMVADHNQIASVVADIVEVNQLASADLSAGTKILVPIQ
jgi:cell division protein YceG involved in septum cleavage